MSNSSINKVFIFNDQIDAEFLFSMYEDDFLYIEEVFSITVTQLDPDLEQVKLAYQQQDLPALRKWVHKIKPSFGFVGLIKTQEACRSFEDLCDQAGSFSAIESKYKELAGLLERSRNIIHSDLEKLTKYNAHNEN